MSNFYKWHIQVKEWLSHHEWLRHSLEKLQWKLILEGSRKDISKGEKMKTFCVNLKKFTWWKSWWDWDPEKGKHKDSLCFLVVLSWTMWPHTASQRASLLRSPTCFFFLALATCKEFSFGIFLDFFLVFLNFFDIRCRTQPWQAQ